MEIRLPYLQVSRVSYQFHVVTSIQSSAARQSGNFRQVVNDTYRSYRPKIPGLVVISRAGSFLRIGDDSVRFVEFLDNFVSVHLKLIVKVHKCWVG